MLAPSRRTVHHAEAVAWLRAQAPLERTGIVTSLPDVSEVPTLGFAGWQDWFREAAAAVFAALPSSAVAIFYQSDIRHQGAWVDKGALVQQAATASGQRLLWHKIVCRKPPGTVTFGRASYAHLLAFSAAAQPSVAALAAAGPDVLADSGGFVGRKGMAIAAAVAACRFIQTATNAACVVDPFCGWGTALAAANALGLDAVGVDLSVRMCRRARQLKLDPVTFAPVTAAALA